MLTHIIKAISDRFYETIKGTPDERVPFSSEGEYYPFLAELGGGITAPRRLRE